MKSGNNQHPKTTPKTIIRLKYELQRTSSGSEIENLNIHRQSPSPRSQSSFPTDFNYGQESNNEELEKPDTVQKAEKSDDEFNDSDKVPLLRETEKKEEKQGWFGWAAKGIYNHVIAPIGHIFKYVAQHPVTTVAAIISAAPSVINSGLGIAGLKAKEISLEKIKQVPLNTKVLAGFAMTSSLAVNVFLNVLYIPKAVGILFSKDIWRNHPFMAASSLLMGSFATYGLWALAFDSFSASILAAITMSVAAIPATFASRFASIYDGMDRITEPFLDADVKFQAEYVNQLKRLKLDFVKKVNLYLEKVAQNTEEFGLDKSDPATFYRGLMLQVAGELDKLSRLDTNLYDPTSCDSECVKSYAALTVDLASALILAMSGYLIFTQKGIDALTLTSKWIDGSNSTVIQDLSEGVKIAAGSGSGFASGALYSLSGFDLRGILVTAALQLSRNPKTLPFGVILLGACVLSAPGMYLVSKTIKESPTHIFSAIINVLQDWYVAFGTYGGFAVNAKGAFNIVFPKQLEVEHPKVKDLVEHFVNTHINKLTSDDINALKQFSIFKTPAAMESGVESGYDNNVLLQTEEEDDRDFTNDDYSSIRPQ
jgi:hypothetical protein